jgi:dCTP deaminase
VFLVLCPSPAFLLALLVKTSPSPQAQGAWGEGILQGHATNVLQNKGGKVKLVPLNSKPLKNTGEITVSIKADGWIKKMAEERKMIEPFVINQVRNVGQNKIISYGLSSYGYDVRCANEFKIFTNINSALVDPKHFDENSFVDIKSDVCIIPPNSFALARTVEYFRIPRNVLTICLGKSTYARCGIIVNVTPLEPEWEGHVTLELSNTTPLPAKIYANEGIAQIIFLEADEVCQTSYKDRGGKYQGQRGVTLPKT